MLLIYSQGLTKSIYTIVLMIIKLAIINFDLGGGIFLEKDKIPQLKKKRT